MARIKWLGTSDELYKLFSTLLKAKQQRETMAVLITENGDTLEDEGDILQEVSRFHGQLFKSSDFNESINLTRRELLQFTTNQVTQEQKHEMESVPMERN